jgi:transposase
MPGFAWRKEWSVVPRARKYPVELLDRATRLVFESGRPIAHAGADLGLPSETLRKYVRQVEADEGRCPDLPSSEEREEIRELRREVAELRRANGRTRSQLELAVVGYVAWFNNERLHTSLGGVPPAEYEQLHTRR